MTIRIPYRSLVYVGSAVLFAWIFLAYHFNPITFGPRWAAGDLSRWEKLFPVVAAANLLLTAYLCRYVFLGRVILNIENDTLILNHMFRSSNVVMASVSEIAVQLSKSGGLRKVVISRSSGAPIELSQDIPNFDWLSFRAAIGQNYPVINLICVRSDETSGSEPGA